jgi:hydroxypyruvate reductase
LTAPARKHALQIFRAALDAADPERAVLRHVKFDGRVLTVGPRKYPLAKFDGIQVVGAGKASAAMARALEKLLARHISSGLINVPDGTTVKLRRIGLNASGHPIPDSRGAQGAKHILDIARAAGERDLLICLISGGASALMPAPVPYLTLAAKREITRKLLASGATIHEMNTVRKHLSQIKGGQLAAAAYPAPVIALILSDVVGDDLDVIGSGPTVPDRSTIFDARSVLKKFNVHVPNDALHETPKPGDLELSAVHHLIVGSNRLAIDAAERKARELGYHTAVLSTCVQGETRDVAAMHAAIAKEIVTSGRPVRRPACVLSGGETTVTIRGTGLGGRNQEFVLAAAIALGEAHPVTVFSAGTDGIDGPTDAAGAIADAATMEGARASGVDARRLLDNNDSYHFFEARNGLVVTGPTGTNVMDVRIMLVPTAP